jgi:hypothetical protein
MTTGKIQKKNVRLSNLKQLAALLTKKIFLNHLNQILLLFSQF